jgi:hypothetical protein
MQFLKNLFFDTERKTTMKLNESEKSFLKTLIIDKIVAQQSLEGSMPSINAVPKSILKKLDTINSENEIMMLPDFEHSATFDAVVFMLGNNEVGRVSLGK